MLTSCRHCSSNHLDYPSNTVPNKVAQLFTAQLFHDRKQRFHRAQAGPEGRAKMGKPIDYLRPIVADADTVSPASDRRKAAPLVGLLTTGHACIRVTVVLPPS